MLNITRGKIDRALKVVAYGSEGIGKTTFAAAFPEPLFTVPEKNFGDGHSCLSDDFIVQVKKSRPGKPCGLRPHRCFAAAHKAA